jgi:uncharacterized protein YciI
VVFILELNYTAPLSRVDALLPAHIRWLNRHYVRGVFLASGRKQPRDGGIIIAVAPSRAAIEQLTLTDPLVIAGACRYRVVEFLPTKTSADLERFQVTL